MNGLAKLINGLYQINVFATVVLKFAAAIALLVLANYIWVATSIAGIFKP